MMQSITKRELRIARRQIKELKLDRLFHGKIRNTEEGFGAGQYNVLCKSIHSIWHKNEKAMRKRMAFIGNHATSANFQLRFSGQHNSNDNQCKNSR